MESLRRVVLAGTEGAELQVETIRLRLLKIAAQVRITARRIWIRCSKAYPSEKPSLFPVRPQPLSPSDALGGPDSRYPGAGEKAMATAFAKPLAYPEETTRP